MVELYAKDLPEKQLTAFKKALDQANKKNPDQLVMQMTCPGVAIMTIAYVLQDVDLRMHMDHDTITVGQLWRLWRKYF